jgi:hypothetical protein
MVAKVEDSNMAIVENYEPGYECGDMECLCFTGTDCPEPEVIRIAVCLLVGVRTDCKRDSIE